MSEIKIMSVQVGWTPDREDNMKRAMTLIDEGISKHGETDVICLPEFFYESPTAKNRDTIGEPLEGKFYSAISDCARKHSVNIVSGTFPQRKDGKLYNTCLGFDREGELVGTYSKAHLFDAAGYKESEYLTAGDSRGIFEFDFGRVAVAICYEIRFPEYLRSLALTGADILMIPAMFYRPRQDQWDALVRGAAVQNLITVVAANQYNKHCFGHSQIAGPDGAVLAQADDKECVIFAKIDTKIQENLRKELAVFENRRSEMYRL